MRIFHIATLADWEADTDRLDGGVRRAPAPGMTETFPHVYGAIRPAAVVGARAL